MFFNNIFKLKNNDLGIYYLSDALLAIILLLIILMAFNNLYNIDNSSYSESTYNFKTSQDVMELMVNQINSNDHSTLEVITTTLSNDNNSEYSINKASIIASSFFSEIIPNKHFIFKENKQLNGVVLASNGNMDNFNNVSVAKRNLGNYSFSLYMW